MCAPNTLHHNEHGYVSWCGKCSCMSLAFGNIMMALTTDQTEAFIRVLALDSRQYEDKICENEKAFVYNTESRHVKLVLNYKEVQNLLDLLNKAWILHQVNMLINDTQKNGSDMA